MKNKEKSAFLTLSKKLKKQNFFENFVGKIFGRAKEELKDKKSKLKTDRNRIQKDKTLFWKKDRSFHHKESWFSFNLKS